MENVFFFLFERLIMQKILNQQPVNCTVFNRLKKTCFFFVVGLSHVNLEEVVCRLTGQSCVVL